MNPLPRNHLTLEIPEKNATSSAMNGACIEETTVIDG
jgi:hypothetical protein